jgi:ADP-ribose pyrophosphatase YjhB (NUDIX family)
MIIPPKDRFKVVLAVHVVLVKENKVLLGRRQNTGWSDEKWHLFGGHVEENEFALDALAREAEEELDIKIDLEKTRLVHVRNILRSDHTRLHLYFLVDGWQGDVSNKEPDKCSELSWFEMNNLPKNMTTDSFETLNNITSKINYSQTDKNE